MNSVLSSRQGVLSTLWIFLSVNYIYCDVLTDMQPEVLQGLMAGTIGEIQVTQGFLLAAAVLMQIPFAMIVLARVLRYPLNRWFNITAATIMALVQIGTMGMGTPPTLHYLFYSAIEIAANLFIIWYAWTWRMPESVAGILYPTTQKI